MTLGNPNLPASLNRRVLAHKRKVLRSKTRPATSRSCPSEPVPKAVIAAGVTRGGKVSSKKARKNVRNKNYALERKKEQMAEELLKSKGEVEMTDAATAPLSKRQQKLAERAAKVAEANAKARAASAAEQAEAAKKAGAEAAMELDI